uniref:Uncharacterized protein n=1 Tax=Thermogemmatispora argillosa TaxID=2045280 RepID=A0A455T6X1_9CHLR|nr:hypothetical protein KTA_29340 [Thermogemmatispora argillosa]
MYRLDFETMKQVMREHRKTGLLYADLPAGVPGMPEPCRVEIILRAGNIVSCFFVGRSGRRLKEEDASPKLARLGKLDWTFVPQEDVPIEPRSTPGQTRNTTTGSSAFPQRLLHLEQWQMVGWSRMHRMVFALADGTRSVEKIAEILSTSPEAVRAVLRDLQAIGVIRL